MPPYHGRPGASPVLAALAASGFLAREDRILDLGCGRGEDVVALARWGARRVAGVDRDAREVAAARRRARRSGVSDRVDLVVGDATRLGELFPAASFDVLLDTLLTNNLEDADLPALARGAARVLAEGGRLVVTVRAIPGLKDAEAAGDALGPALARAFRWSPVFPTAIPERGPRGRRSFADVQVAIGWRRG